MYPFSFAHGHVPTSPSNKIKYVCFYLSVPTSYMPPLAFLTWTVQMRNGQKERSFQGYREPICPSRRQPNPITILWVPEWTHCAISIDPRAVFLLLVGANR